MTRHAAYRLYRDLRRLGYRVRVRQHQMPTGSFYSVRIAGPKTSAAAGRFKLLLDNVRPGC